MDIVIRNGVIDNEESKRILNVKNEAGLLKKNYADFVHNTDGPYYDFLQCHICIPRSPHLIGNFYGVQDSQKIKLIDNREHINPNSKYCTICHEEVKQNTAFPAKRRILLEENIFETKQEEEDLLDNSFKKLKIIDNEINKEINKENTIITKKSKGLENLADIETEINNIEASRITKQWNKLYNEYIEYNRTKKFNETKLKYKKMVDRWYKITYKLVKEPISYNISIFETKILNPWELTNYQKFKLMCPDYKDSPMFSHQRRSRIITNYVTIE